MTTNTYFDEKKFKSILDSYVSELMRPQCPSIVSEDIYSISGSIVGLMTGCTAVSIVYGELVLTLAAIGCTIPLFLPVAVPSAIITIGCVLLGECIGKFLHKYILKGKKYQRLNKLRSDEEYLKQNIHRVSATVQDVTANVVLDIMADIARLEDETDPLDQSIVNKTVTVAINIITGTFVFSYVFLRDTTIQWYKCIREKCTIKSKQIVNSTTTC